MRLIPFSTSWTAKPQRNYKNAPVRRRAAAYADRRYTREDIQWKICFEGFLAGAIYTNRLKCLDVRVRLKS
jgi:hypothetical protein